MARYVLNPLDGQLVKLTERPAVVREASAREIKITPADVTTSPTGRLVAAFATLNVIDSDADVTLPGAFPTGDVVLSQWGHASWQPGFLPIGRGRIAEEGNRAIFRGQFFMGMAAGRETFEALKGLRELAEFSYGFQIAESDRGTFQGQMVRFLRKLVVSEVSPVLRGAGVATGVVEMSSIDPAQVAWAAAVHANEIELARLAGHVRPKRRLVGYAPDGARVFTSATGRP